MTVDRRIPKLSHSSINLVYFLLFVMYPLMRHEIGEYEEREDEAGTLLYIINTPFLTFLCGSILTLLFLSMFLILPTISFSPDSVSLLCNQDNIDIPTLSPSPKPATYTVNKHLTHRWPVPISASLNEDDPFLPHIPRFSTIRAAVLSYYSIGQCRWMRLTFKGNANNFFSQIIDHTDWIVFYTYYPSNARSDLESCIQEIGGIEKVDPSSALYTQYRDRYSRLHPNANINLFDSTAVNIWTYSTIVIITCPLAINLPRWLTEGDAIIKLELPDWKHCSSRTFSLDYIIYTSIYTNQILKHPLLDGYDYTMKLDWDILFIKKIPFSPFISMAQQNCIWLHSNLYAVGTNGNGHGDQDCQTGSYDAIRKAAKQYNILLASDTQGWFILNDVYFSNVVIGWNGWLRSPETLMLATYLYEEEEIAGYFHHRWTDQASWPKFLGAFYNLTQAEAEGKKIQSIDSVITSPSSNDVVCDMTEWRDLYFIHGPDEQTAKRHSI